MTNNTRDFVPPIFAEKGFTDIICMSPTSQGISSVYKVTKPQVGTWIIKRIKKEFAILHKAEKSILTQLRHDFLPIIFDIFEDQQALYIAMEFIPGVSLQQLIDSDEILAEPEARKYFLQLCELFEYLHGKGVVHKDCKPSNIMLSDNKNVYLIDFGISKSEEYNPSGRSHRYASPEQVKNPNIGDPRTDIYSLGATMYSLITKELPNKVGFDDKTVYENLWERTDISKVFKRVVTKCMAQNVKARYQSMGDVKKDLLKRGWVWKIVLSFAMILISTVMVFFGVMYVSDDIVNRLIPRGNEMMDAGNYQLALSHYERYIRRRQWSPTGYERRRNLLRERGQIDESLQLLAIEDVHFEYFLETSPEFKNTWVATINAAIAHYYEYGEWHVLLELLHMPRVRAVIPARQNADMQVQVHVQLEEYETALEIGRAYNSPTLPYVYDMIRNNYISRALEYNSNNEFLQAVNLLNSALEEYPQFYYSFEILNTRAVIMLSYLLSTPVAGTDFNIFVEYANAALAVARPEDAMQVNALNISLQAFE